MSKGFDMPGSDDFGSEPTHYQEQPASYEPDVKPGHGCCFYGCITAFVLFILVLVATWLAVRFVTGKFREYVSAYTEAAPRPLPVVDIPEEERAEIVKRAEDFRKRLTTEPAPGEPRTLTDRERTLVLTADELNAIVEKSPEARGKFHVTIDDGELGAQVSIPLNELPGLKGRYLNGDAKVRVSVVDGEPVVRLHDVRVKGKPLPDSFRKMVEGMNLLSQQNTSNGQPMRPPLVRKLESVEVKDGKLTIVARKEPAAPAPESEASGSSGIVTWRVEDGGNGHSYELVRVKRSWTEADADARRRTHDGVKGHLATIADVAENAFLRDRVAVDALAWIGLTDDPEHGGKESRSLPDPSRDGWAWVTGEPVAFVAWSEGQPDHGGEKPENFVEFNGVLGPKRGQWSDQANDAGAGRFAIVEYDVPPAQAK